MDIRKFFQAKNAPKVAGAAAQAEPKVEPKQEPDGGAAAPPAKKSKYFDDGSTKAEPADVKVEVPSGKSVAGKAATPPSASKRAKKDEKKEAGKATPGKKGKGVSEKADKPASGSARKKAKAVKEEVIMVEDSDEDVEMVDPEEAAELQAKAKAAKSAKGAAGKKRGRAVIEDDDDVEVVMAAPPKPASQKPASQPASQPPKPSGRALPGSLAATPAGAKAGAASQDTPKVVSGGRGKNSKAASATARQVLDAKGEAAAAAVKAAIAKLPAEEDVKFSFMPEGAGGIGGGNEGTEPPHRGQKEMPRGHPDALFGYTFVVTGVLDSLYREECEDLIKRHNGRVTKAVSGKTTFLIVGENCGRSKYHEAQKHSTKLIDEDGLFSLIGATSHLVEAPPAPAAVPAAAPAPAAAPRPLSGASTGMSGAAARASGVAAAPSRQSGSAAAGNGDGLLWVDKHKPKTSAELVGNPGVIKTLRDWLSGWEAVHRRGEAAPAAGTSARPKDLGKKAVLLSGPPGIGKTSAAHIIARECGYEVVEMNASDTRNKSDTKVSAGIGGKLANVIKECATNTSLLFTGAGQQKRQLLIMDECDGMSAGDRGGVADLIQTIQKSKIPIICIANDKWCQKLKSLRNYTLELDFHKPTDDAVSRRMLAIAQREGLSVNEAALKELARSSNGDVRAVLGQLQMVRLRASALTYDEVKGRMGTSKDMDMSPFECARKLLDAANMRMSTTARMDLYFADADLVPLLVQENYVNHRPQVARTEGERLRALAKAADCISIGDTVNCTLRRTNNWSLAPLAGLVGCVMPATYMMGPREVFGLYPGEMNFPRFTAWMGVNSTTGKQRRLLSELTTAMAASGNVPATRSGVRLEYCSALRTLLTAPLRQQEDAGVPATLGLMQDYCINREQLDYILDVTKFKTKAPWGEDPLKDVPPKVKAALTRQFNKEGLTPRYAGMVEDVGVKKGRGKGKPKAKAVGEEDEEGGEEGGEAAGVEGAQAGGAEEEEEEDEEALQARLAKEGIQIEAKAAPSGKATGKGAKSGAGSSKGARGGGSTRGGRAGGSGRGGGRGKK